MLIVGTAGHIDHGKSALIEALTGTHPDRLKEEQKRGITIDLGFAHAEIDGRTVSFVDVPGHERFVRHMLAGTGGIEAVLFVVAATESIKPQTREHFEICRLLGIDRGVIALTKCDLADDAAIDAAVHDVRSLVAGSLLETAPIVRVSVRTGQGLDVLRQAIASLPPARARAERSGLVRLPVDRAFTLKGFGTVVTGTLVSGHFAVGDTITVFPEEQTVRVRGLQVHGRSVPDVTSPSRAAVNLTGVDVAAVSRGTTLATAGSLVVTRRLDVHLRAIDGARALRHGSRVRVHQGTSETLARVAIAAIRAPRSAEWTAIQPGDREVSLEAGGEAYAQLRLERPAAFTRWDRLILRACSPLETIGGAVVLDPQPPGSGIRRKDALPRFTALETTDNAIALWVGAAGPRGLPIDVLVSRGGLDPAAAEAWTSAALDDGRVVRAGGRLFDARVAAAMAQSVESILATAHRDAPHEAGMQREKLRSAVAPAVAPELFDLVIDRLRGARMVAGADRLALAVHQPRQTESDARLDEAVVAAFEKSRLAPPDVAELAGALHLDTPAVEAAVRRLTGARHLVRVQAYYFHAAALQQLKLDLRTWVKPGDHDGVDVAAFKTRYSLTRKFAIPLLEWLDRERVTRRVGDRRVVL